MSVEQKITASQACHIDGRAGYFRFRQAQLQGLYNLVSKNRDAFVAALRSDTQKNEFEAVLEVNLVLKQLRAGFEATAFDVLTARAKEQYLSGTVEAPQGTVLIVGHWTAPLDSVLGPLCAAITAGNVAVAVLPAPAMSTYELLIQLSPRQYDVEAYPVLLGTEAVINKALSFRFNSYYGTVTDHGLRQQLVTAATRADATIKVLPSATNIRKHNIAIVNKTIPESQLVQVAREVCRASFGCVGGQGLGHVSVVLVHGERHDAFSREMVRATRHLFPSSGRHAGMRDLCPLNVTETELSTLGAAVKEGNLVCGGEWDAATGWFAPTILENVNVKSSLLATPLAGPILPLVPFHSTEEAIRIAQDITGHNLAVFGTQKDKNYFTVALCPSRATTGCVLGDLVGLAPGPDNDRYPASLFTTITVLSEADASIKDLFPPYSAWQISLLDKILLPKSPKELKAKRPMHQSSVGRNFFLQGAMLSVVIIVSLLGAAGLVAYMFLK